MKTIKRMESKIKRLKKQAKRIDDELFKLNCKLHDAKVDAEKLRLIKKRIEEETPKYRKVKYHWLPRGNDFSESDMSDVVPCKYCGWPVADYEHSWFHIMGRFGESPKCGNAVPSKAKGAAA